PAGAVVVLGDAVEAQLLIVVRADELRRVERSAFECPQHLIGRHLLWLDAEPGENLPAHATDSELEPAQIVDGPNFFAEPPAHLGSRVPYHDGMDTKLMQRFVDDLSAAGLPPCVLMARIEPEGYPSAECQSRVSIGVKVGRRLGAFDSAVGDC